MALAIDGYAVLGRIAANPDAFAGIRTDASKAAQTLVLAQLKGKASTFDTLRAVRRALNAESFALIVEALKDTQVKSLVTKFDKHNVEMKAASAQARRHRLCALADGSAVPVQKAVKKGARPKKIQRLSSEAMRARRRRERE